MKIIALIPARLESTRFPGKLLKKIGHMTVIGRTYTRVADSGLFDEVAVVTDSDDIERDIRLLNGQVLRSTMPHDSGTDRIAEFASRYSEDDIIINVQGDEPFIEHGMLAELIGLMKARPGDCKVGTLMHRISSEEEIQNPNAVKVVSTEDGRVLFFSRAPIPYNRDKLPDIKYFRHIGIYAFTRKSLDLFTRSPMSTLERIEKLENLRFLELGIPVYISETRFSTIGIDTEEDWIKASRHKGV